MTDRVEFEFVLTGTGWAAGTLTVGDSSAAATASYLGDALGEIVRAVRDAVAGVPEARASWDEEPGEYRWIFSQDGLFSRVRLLAFPEWRAIVEAPDDDGEMLLDARCETAALGEAVALGARAVLDQMGVDGYRAQWIEHDFPLDDLASLEAVLPSGT